MKKLSLLLMVLVLSGISLSTYAYTDESGNTNDRNTFPIKKCLRTSHGIFACIPRVR